MCGSASVRYYGTTALLKQRFQCLCCKRTFIWTAKHNRIFRHKYWFKLWITESDSVRRLCQLSGYSPAKLQRIKNYWLKQMPEEQIEYSQVHYVVYDATYFHKDGCLLNLMDGTNQKILTHRYVKKESFKEAYPWFLSLRQEGLNPLFITTDGERSIMRAMRLVWPQTRLQRCLYHLKHEGMRWLRTYPKTEAGKELRTLLSGLCRVKTLEERDSFIKNYQRWITCYREFVLSLPRSTVACKDLKRTMGLINHALPDMFYYLEDKQVHATTNALEAFHSRLKADYRRHRGLSKNHRIQYIHWFCYYENEH